MIMSQQHVRRNYACMNAATGRPTAVQYFIFEYAYICMATGASSRDQNSTKNDPRDHSIDYSLDFLYLYPPYFELL